MFQPSSLVRVSVTLSFFFISSINIFCIFRSVFYLALPFSQISKWRPLLRSLYLVSVRAGCMLSNAPLPEEVSNLCLSHHHLDDCNLRFRVGCSCLSFGIVLCIQETLELPCPLSFDCSCAASMGCRKCYALELAKNIYTGRLHMMTLWSVSAPRKGMQVMWYSRTLFLFGVHYVASTPWHPGQFLRHVGLKIREQPSDVTT